MEASTMAIHSLKKLFEPGNIGPLQIRNRIVLPAVCDNFATDDGFITERAIEYYRRRSQGGVGMVIYGASVIYHPQARAVINSAISDDKYIPGLAKLAEAIKSGGAKACIQIMHAGRQTKSSIAKAHPVCPSPVPFIRGSLLYPEVPRELTKDEIREIIKAFGTSARRAKEAGWNAVELHAAHGYLLHTFLNPYINMRRDEYGGLEGGLRFMEELIGEVKDNLGKDMALLVRINGEDYVAEGGITLLESQIIAKALEKFGVDAINISGRTRDTNHPLGDASMASPPGTWVYTAEAIKKAVNIPVIIVHRIYDPFFAEQVLAEGKADFVAVARQTLADPDWPTKAKEGRIEDIRPCIYCNEGCYDTLWTLIPITCTVNPMLGREYELKVTPASKAKNVIVVGGGPAGLSAAETLARRGHKVTLFEKSYKLGGMYIYSVGSPLRQEIARIIKYYETQLYKLGVDVKLGKEFTPDMVSAYKPDVVVVATGAEPIVPKLEGMNSGYETPKVVNAVDVLADRFKAGDKVFIWTCSYYCPYVCGTLRRVRAACGAGYAAVFAAEKLISEGKLVYLVSERSEIAPGIGFTTRVPLFNRLFFSGVKMAKNIRVKGITDGGVIVSGAGIDTKIAVDTFVYSVGFKPNRRLVDALKGKVPELYVIGDAAIPSNAPNAIHDGFEVALKI
ncbi:MAG: FAD-dependent oxidoreductase [Candidatus Nezhaarchaeota archaeon]|nr:FAD-dependent oxidoreductase [Candidatus Nezhaarchaeota archaeon]